MPDSTAGQHDLAYRGHVHRHPEKLGGPWRNSGPDARRRAHRRGLHGRGNAGYLRDPDSRLDRPLGHHRGYLAALLPHQRYRGHARRRAVQEFHTGLDSEHRRIGVDVYRRCGARRQQRLQDHVPVCGGDEFIHSRTLGATNPENQRRRHAVDGVSDRPVQQRLPADRPAADVSLRHHGHRDNNLRRHHRSTDVQHRRQHLDGGSRRHFHHVRIRGPVELLHHSLMLGVSAFPRYYALLYRTVTGEVINDFPLAKVPNWLQQVNADGSWSVQTQIGATGGFSREELWDYTDAWRYSVAVCYGTGARPGDYICQAGPLLADQLMSEQPPLIQLGGTGLWGLLRMVMQILAGWVPGSGFGAGADILYTTLSLPNSAVNSLTNALGGAGRSPAPIDIPAATFSGDPAATPTTIQYFGYDLASAGQRLQELTQMQYGPDILLKPYFSDFNHIRHKALIGNPK